MRNLLLGASAAACLSLVIGIAQAAHDDATPIHRRSGAIAPASPGVTGYYIVRLQDAPAATYTGGVAGFAATDARANGERVLDVRASASYAAYLDERQSAVLDQAARMLGHAVAVRYRYHLGFNGMSVQLTPAEAERMAALPGVVSVQPVRRFAPSTVAMPAAASDTNASRAWVNAPTLWQLPSMSNPGAIGPDNEGEGIVLADLDTGINDANSSFAATGLDNYVAQDPGGLRFGVCDPANTKQHNQEPAFFNCNDKLIGAYTYTQGSGNDPNSPEDSEGHGSHTASTVVGDFTTTTVNGQSTSLSGMAPHASIIAYDICDPKDLCVEDDSVAAVEQAIKDQATLQSDWHSAFKGMVLNFSIGGSSDSPYDDPVEQAFLSAAEAGIYVSAAGGNGGPANVVINDPKNDPVYNVQHLAPWVTTMAAATHDGAFSSNKLENFSGGNPLTMPTAAMAGDGNTAGFGPQPLVRSSGFSAGLTSCGTEPSGIACVSAGSASADADQCTFPFTPGTFTASEIVVCDRGTNPLVDKAYNVQQGGALGMVIATTSGSSQDMVVEPYVIPATLLDLKDGNKLRAWLTASVGAAMPPSADLSGSTLTTDRSQADQIAGFSSRGPVGSKFDAVIKPDLAGPGVSVLAAVNDPGYADGCSTPCASTQPESFDFFDGTSMATPHDSGAAALLMQVHPGWTPAEIKSVLMLTAVTSKNGVSPGVGDQCAKLDSGNNCVSSKALPSPQVRGAGRIDVDAAARSGLMMDEKGSRYAAADPDKGGDFSSLNLASLGNAGCAGTCSWTRTVKSTFHSARVTYHVSVSGLTGGMEVSVSPASFTLGPRQSQVLTIQADVSKAATDKWAFAEVDLTTSNSGDGGAAIPDMHMPVAVQAIAAPPGSVSNKSSGGGGDMGLFGLATLLLAWRRRKPG